jgi:hypothetical protein
MMKSHGIAAIAFALVLALGIAGVAGAQARERERGTIATTGDITELDAAKRSITIKDSNDESATFVVEENATILKGSTEIKLEDLKVGWNVTAAGNELRETKALTYIKVMKAPDAE